MNSNFVSYAPIPEEETNDATFELSSHREQARYKDLKDEAKEIQTILDDIPGWQTGNISIPARYTEMNLAFLSERLGAAQSIVDDLIKLYEAIADSEQDAREADDADDSDGVEEAEEELEILRELIEKKDDRLQHHKVRYPDY
ncbi:hypothetical protein FKW77_008839 [Venturia effusa]|uniref:Uncharacterized protein n=1 Tax=Venturia effusa TaxID=50376 RepID=A0A517L9V4_9PEZI|nr:hypothetical protein FKW77_008839 [Venturia effusa]